MPKIITMYVIICLLFFSCERGSETQYDINYDHLNEISLDLIFEVEPSEKYFPGELREMLVMKDGTLIVSDLRKGTIDQLNSEGIYVATVAEQGEGPGELPSFFSIFRKGDSSFGVWNNQNRQLDFFIQDKRGVYIYDESVAGQSAHHQRLEVIGHHYDDYYFALTGKPDWEFISHDNPDYRKTPVSLIDRSLNIVTDSKYTLQFPNNLFGDPDQFTSRVTMNGLAFLGVPPFRYRDRFKILNDGRYIIAEPKADRALFVIYGQNHDIRQHLDVGITPRYVEQEDLDHALSAESDRNVIRVLEDRVDNQKPVFLNFWSSKYYLWLHTDTVETGKQFVVLDLEGKPIGAFYLEEHEELQVAEDNRLYILNKNPEKGHTIRVYDVDL